MNSFDISELEDLQKDLINLARESFPKETQKFVRDEAKKGKNIAKKIAKSEIKKKTGKYFKSFKTGKSALDDKFSYKFYNDSWNRHWIEDGHFIVSRGESKSKGGTRRSGAGGEQHGFVEGKKIFTKAQVQMESEFSKDVDDFISSLMDKTIK